MNKVGVTIDEDTKKELEKEFEKLVDCLHEVFYLNDYGAPELKTRGLQHVEKIQKLLNITVDL